MKFVEVLEALKSGYKIKLPEWEGYWQLKDNDVMIHCRDGKVINLLDTQDVLYTLSNIAREDWEITEQSNIDITATMRFGEALLQLQQGNRVARKGWNGKGIYLELQYPENSNKMTQPYIYIVTTNLDTDNPYAPKGIVPWFASQTDMLANDWMIINNIDKLNENDLNDIKNIKIGTKVQVTKCYNGQWECNEYIPIGTICKVIGVNTLGTSPDEIQFRIFRILPIDLDENYDKGFWYHRDEFEIIEEN